jgi:hypothetical protein
MAASLFCPQENKRTRASIASRVVDVYFFIRNKN